MLSPVLAKTIRPAHLIVAGLAIAVAGAFVIAQTESWGLYAVVFGFMAFNGGCAPMVVLANGIVMTAVIPERAGAAAALTETSAETGFSLGIAVLGSAAAAIYRSGLDLTLPAGLPAEAAIQARDTLANAIAVAQTLSPDLNRQLVTTAQAAFMDGMQLAIYIVAAILAGVGLTVLIQMRHLPPLTDGPPPHGDTSVPAQ